MTNILKIGGDLVRWGDAGARVAPEPDEYGRRHLWEGRWPWTVPVATPAYVVLQELEGGRSILDLIDDLGKRNSWCARCNQYLGEEPEALAFAIKCAAARPRGVELTPVENLTEAEVRLALDDPDPDNPIAIAVAELRGMREQANAEDQA
jgi:hypothetical protein